MFANVVEVVSKPCNTASRTPGLHEAAWNMTPPEHKAMSKIRQYNLDPKRISFSLYSIPDSEVEVPIKPSC